MTVRPVYWLLHLPSEDRAPNALRSTVLPPLAVQLLGPDGGPTETIAFFSPEASVVLLAGQPLPDEVINRAKRLQVGEGVYVDSVGNAVEPF